MGDSVYWHYFFERINLREILQEAIPIRENSPNGMGIYGKVLAYILLIYAGGSRFSHLLYLGWHEVLRDLFAVGRIPLASTTLTRLFKKIRKLKEVEELSEGLWGYLKGLIPWTELKEDWLTFDSTVLERYGKQEGVKRGYNPKKKGRGSHSPLRYKYLVLPAQIGGDGRKLVLRISVCTQKVRSKLLYLFNRIKQYVPHDCGNCTAFG